MSPTGKDNAPEFQWLNESEMTERDGVISILAPEHTDFFCNSGAEAEEGDAVPDSLCNAPFYYTEVEGDFVLRVKVSHDFKQTYDSCSIMVFKDLIHWAKACFELTDFGTRAMVSVVTKDVSDDANGPNVDADAVWLQMCRKGDAFASAELTEPKCPLCGGALSLTKWVNQGDHRYMNLAECGTDGKLLMRVRFKHHELEGYTAACLVYKADDEMQSYYALKASQPRSRGRRRRKKSQNK